MANRVSVVVDSANEVIFGDAVGDDIVWTTGTATAIATGAGRQSATWTPGATQRSGFFSVRFYVQTQATPTLRGLIELYMKTGGAADAHPDNDEGTGDRALTDENKLLNLHPLKHCIVDQAAANTEFVSSMMSVAINFETLAMVLFNNSGASLTEDDAETKAIITPVPPEIQ